MGESKRRMAFLEKTLTQEDIDQRIIEAKRRMAAGRIGFSPDIGEALYALGHKDKSLFIVGAYFTHMMEQDGRMELHGSTYGHFETADDIKYAVTIATQQTAKELLKLLHGADPDEIILSGVLDSDTVEGDSGEIFRRIIGKVIVLGKNDEAPGA